MQNAGLNVIGGVGWGWGIIGKTQSWKVIERLLPWSDQDFAILKCVLVFVREPDVLQRENKYEDKHENHLSAHAAIAID
jgi:hypothetical protein